MFIVLNFIYSFQGFQGFGFGDGGFQMSFGIGAFPFGIFATAFNINDGRPPPGRTLFSSSFFLKDPWNLAVCRLLHG